MHGEEARAEPRHAFDARRYRIADVVQFQVEENALARLHELWRIIEPAGKGELIADLVERDGITQARDHLLRRVDRRHIQRDNQALARVHLSSLGMLNLNSSSRPIRSAGAAM